MVSKNHFKVKGGSAKINHGIFYIAPAPPVPINNDQSLKAMYSWRYREIREIAKSTMKEIFCISENGTYDGPKKDAILIKTLRRKPLLK